PLARAGPVDRLLPPAARLWPSSECPAVVVDRTLRAERGSRFANERAELHQRLIEPPSAFSVFRHQLLGELPDVLGCECSLQHSPHVRIDRRNGFFIREARNRSCCVRTATR